MDFFFMFISNLKGKKIVFLGLNKLSEQLSSIFPWEVSYFVDLSLDESKDGEYLGKPICDIKKLLEEKEKNNIAVIICGRHNVFVENLLKSIGLERNVHYWFGYTLLEWFVYNKQRLENEKRKPTQIVMMDGGLGSQLYQYAIGRLLETRLGVSVKYDVSWFERCGKDIHNKENRLLVLPEVFGVELERATTEEIFYYKAFCYYNHSNIYMFDEELVNKPCDRYIDGYLANYRYIALREQELCNELQFKISLNEKNRDLKQQILNTPCSIAIHIRRGDYVGSAFELLTLQYYLDAIDILEQKCNAEKVRFFIFSNDLEWAKSNIKASKSVTFVEGNDNDNGACDMYLMSLCKHFILSNSSFGFWGAVLAENKDKIVIVPDEWFNEENRMADAKFKEMVRGHKLGLSVNPSWIRIPVKGINGVQ